MCFINIRSPKGERAAAYFEKYTNAKYYYSMKEPGRPIRQISTIPLISVMSKVPMAP
jgi:hypothetical protein